MPGNNNRLENWWRWRQFAERSRLEVQNVRIQDKDQGAHEAGNVVVRQAASCQEDANSCDNIAQHGGNASGQPCTTESVVPDTRQHSHMGWWQPHTTQLRVTRRVSVQETTKQPQI